MSVYFDLRKQRWLQACGQRLLTGLAALALMSLPAYGQRLDPVLLDAFLADPLTADPRDPLLPTLVVDRPLSPLELYAVELELFKMDAQARELMLVNQPDAAFELWMREVQLRRLFGLDAELEALNRISQQAWNAQRSQEVRLMSVRLERIWEAEKATADLERVEAIAAIAQILRMRDTSTEIYQQLIAMTAANPEVQQGWVVILAGHYLQWFDFDNAAQLYTQLAASAKTTGNTLEQTQYLTDLIYSYQQAKDYAQALPAQSELLRLYRVTGQSDREPPLEIDMARNFRALSIYPQALEYYNLAYVTAQSLQLYGHVTTVLKDLGDLYAEQGLTNEALTMYNLLVRAEQQAYNQHGILEAYDRLGQLYLSIGDTENALVAFRAGVAFAESLQYRESYFRGEVAKLSLESPPEETPAEEDSPSLGESLRENLRDNPPFDLAPVEIEPPVVEPTAPAEPEDATDASEQPAPEVEVISDETIDVTPEGETND
ncbi:tpr repeat-containing protein [Leptolyngbya sp. Heron Island J]|uniref:tetratricopeptide repeat protein n=1 Tax=Leptolyngbya sp. Heron Island J TaxID=1385935 RepID=UPI0003B9B068|nr:tpr repeat-containing protein [Leptolyngbya sp. Heron Island J]ESA32034.1 tpr repeat-containing protein [Leptolyngbya sp. Heron Island J]